MTSEEIISKLPYSSPFLFVDEITSISDEGVQGSYVFNPEMDFYKGHFKDNPITPGVILIEVMAQIGVVCLGIYILSNEFTSETQIALTGCEVEFIKPVFPSEKVMVVSEKIYFRFGKLKCNVKMINNKGVEVCKGVICGMII